MRLREALALGALHGPAELLPISSTGHVELIPRLAGWQYPSLDPELRKAFEVALHAGSAAALLVALRREVVATARERRLGLLAGATIVPAVAGLLLERPVERRLGGPRAVATGLAAGAIAMLAADELSPSERGRDEATVRDGLALGLAQACALAPGVSRNGATLAAARWRRFRRPDASALSRHVALPTILGATALKGARLVGRGLPRDHRAGFAAGTAAAFVATLASRPLVRDDRPLWRFAVYRLALASLTAAALPRIRRP